jgi:hypothetical protein
MKHVFSFLSAILLVISISAQAPLQWGIASQAKGDFYDDAASVTFDSQNNLYVTGYFASDSITFGNITLHSAGVADAYVVKYDPQLNPIWAISFGGSAEEYGLGISCDSSDHIIVVGNFASASITLGSTTLVNRSVNTPDMFIARLDANGNFIWARGEGSTNWDNCAGVDMNTTNGDIYVSAAYYLDTMFIGNDTLLNRGGYDMALLKFDINGNYLWSRNAGGNFNDLANAVAYDANGYVITSGGFASTSIVFPTDSLVNPVTGLPETFVVKYDENGNCIWAKRAGAGDNDHSVAIDVDQNGEIYVGGHYHSGSFIFGNDTLVNQGQGDVYLLVYDANGNQLWAKSAGGIEQDFGYGVFVDASGNIYYCGMFQSLSIDFGPYTMNNSNVNDDMFLMVYDAAGNETGSLTGGGLGADYISYMVVNPNGIYAVGSFGTPVLTLGTSTLTNADASGNTSDMFIATTAIALNTSIPQNENLFQVFPNPSNGIFSFSSSISGTAEVKVYNSLGQEIISREETNAQQFSLDLRNQPDGTYFVKVNCADQIFSEQVVVAH